MAYLNLKFEDVVDEFKGVMNDNITKNVQDL